MEEEEDSVEIATRVGERKAEAPHETGELLTLSLPRFWRDLCQRLSGQWWRLCRLCGEQLITSSGMRAKTP